MSCPACENPVIPSYDYCPKCGSWLLSGTPSAYSPTVPLDPRGTYPGNQGLRGHAQTGLKDENLAFVLEVIPGLFGFLGIGHIYAGNVTRGVTLLVCYWLFVTVEFGLIFVLVGLCLTPANFILPLLSALWVKRELEGRTRARLPA